MPTNFWTTEDSVRLYRIGGWGRPYFSINADGEVEVSSTSSTPGVALPRLIADLRARGLELPLLIRFPHILKDRIDRLNTAFAKAIDKYRYASPYQGVYPVKVNQQRHLVQAVVEAGARWGFGLEVGSKPELLIALASFEGERRDDWLKAGSSQAQRLVICNGYKDFAYLEMALIARKLGQAVVVVLERPEELSLVLRAAQELGVQPALGVRVRLSTRGAGHWADSTGDRAKFGFSPSDLVGLVESLRAAGRLDCLQLLHFHMGSQVSSIHPVRNALREAAQTFVEMARLGCPLRYLDIGGGLAVDYDGSRSQGPSSRNYGLQEYAYDVVATVADTCNQAQVPHPILVSESGRSIAAYQSVLVFEAVGVSGGVDATYPPATAANAGARGDAIADGCEPAAAQREHRVLQELRETLQHTNRDNLQESWHDAVQAKEEAQSLFRLGFLPLSVLAEAEHLFASCCERLTELLDTLEEIPQELRSLQEVSRTIYYCNFSIFQSAPDVWAIGQVFPVMPIHRLTEKPTVRAVLADLTCDSDGMIGRFIQGSETTSSIRLHSLKPKEPYQLGMFLNGAYQEILGDLHNLFGDTHAVHVQLTDQGYEVAEMIRGDAIGDVLRYVQYEPAKMLERVRRKAERARLAGTLDLEQMQLFLNLFAASLEGYTYLHGDNRGLLSGPRFPTGHTS